MSRVTLTLIFGSSLTYSSQASAEVPSRYSLRIGSESVLSHCLRPWPFCRSWNRALSCDLLHMSNGNAQLFRCLDLGLHTRADPGSAHPRSGTMAQDVQAQLQPYCPFGWVLIVQDLRIEQVDSDRGIALLDGHSAASYCKGHVPSHISRIWRHDVEQFATHFVTSSSVKWKRGAFQRPNCAPKGHI